MNMDKYYSDIYVCYFKMHPPVQLPHNVVSKILHIRLDKHVKRIWDAIRYKEEPQFVTNLTPVFGIAAQIFRKKFGNSQSEIFIKNKG